MIMKKDKLKKDDRILELGVLGDIEPTATQLGSTDKRLYKGGNKLHAFYNPMNGFWKLRYETGELPGALQNSWTTFEQLLNDTDRYYRTRGLYIQQVLD